MSIDCNDSLTINIDKNKEESAKILGVNRDADIREVKKQYFKLAAKYHPDKGGDKETFQKISNAYSFLVDIPEYEADYKKRCDDEDEVQAKSTESTSTTEPIVVSTVPIETKVSVLPTEPTKPYVPTETKVPIDTKEPVIPTEPMKPYVPTEPVKPYVPIDTKVPTDTIQPLEIIQPSTPSVSTTVSEPLQLIQSNRPLDTMGVPLPVAPKVEPAIVLPPNNLAKVPLDENNEICLVFDANKKFPVAFIPCQKKKSNTFKTGGRKMRKSKRRLHKSRKGHKKNKKQRTCKRR
jgi:hypothetical protein